MYPRADHIPESQSSTQEEVDMAFTDRVVEYPGRVRLTAVSGETDVYDMTREEGTVTEAGTPLNANNINTEIANVVADQISAINIDSDGNVTVRNIQSGAESITVTTAGEPKAATVTFSQAFTSPPYVTVTPMTKYPGTIMATAVSVSATGFTIYLYRPSTGSNTVHWIAVGS